MHVAALYQGVVSVVTGIAQVLRADDCILSFSVVSVAVAVVRTRVAAACHAEAC